MRLWCWYCHKSVSSELPGDAVFRAVAVCPECLEKSSEAAMHPLRDREPCLCGHPRSKHDDMGVCVQLGCDCVEFESALKA